MAYDEGLAQRVRELLESGPPTVERRMFGGLAFLVGGHMAVGINAERLMVRCGPTQHAQLLQRPHASPMDFTGRPLKGFIYVEPTGLESEQDLAFWVSIGTAFAASLPPK